MRVCAVRESEYNYSTGPFLNMRDSEEAGSSGNVTTPKKKAKVWYQQAFKIERMEDDELKDWIQPDPTDKYTVLYRLLYVATN